MTSSGGRPQEMVFLERRRSIRQMTMRSSGWTTRSPSPLLHIQLLQVSLSLTGHCEISSAIQSQPYCDPSRMLQTSCDFTNMAQMALAQQMEGTPLRTTAQRQVPQQAQRSRARGRQLEQMPSLQALTWSSKRQGP